MTPPRAARDRLAPSVSHACVARLLSCVLLLASLASATIALAQQARPAGPVIERVLGDVWLARSGDAVAPRAGMTLSRFDRLITGPQSRAAIAFPDGSRLLLGAEAEATVADFIAEEGRQRATLRLDVPRGPFRLILADPRPGPQRQVLVRAAGITLMLSSGDLWVGPTSSGTAVLAIYGRVEVRNAGGSLILDRKRQGTLLRAATAVPDLPAVWPRERIEHALTQVAFD